MTANRVLYSLARRLVLGAAFVMLAGAAAPAFAQDISIVDDRGVAVAVPKDPKRIAGVSYFAADTALALGFKPVATTYMVEGRFPEFLGGYIDDVAQVGQRATPNLELLAQAKPDVIVAMLRYTEGAADQFQNIAPYLAYNLELYSDSDRTIMQMATMLGKQDRAKELNEGFAKHIEEIAAKAPKDVHPRFQIMWAGDAPWTFYTENMTAAIVAAIGGDNIAGHNPTPHVPENFGVEMSLETMLEKDPEVIFVYDYGPDRPQENNPIWSQLSAVKNGRVFYVGDEWVEAHGPIAREMVLLEAAHYLYPDTFPMPDIKAEAAKYIPVDLQ